MGPPWEGHQIVRESDPNCHDGSILLILAPRGLFVFLREFGSCTSPYFDQNLLTDESREDCLIASPGSHSFDCEL